MSYRSERVVGLLALTLVVAGSCAVFPDEATLPKHAGSAAAAGAENAPQAGHGGQDMVDVTPEAGSGGDGTAAGGTAGAGGSALVMGGAGASAGGDSAAGAGGGTGVSCLNPRAELALITDDTWIGSAKPGTGHANDVQLSVVAGNDEHRALMKVTLPVAPVDAILRKATLVLQLESNADAELSERRLGLHRLDHELDAPRTTWTNYANGGNGHWLTPGGDFALEVGHASLPEGSQKLQATFNITSFVRETAGAVAIPLSLIVLETTSALPAPAELAFTSVEGDTAARPQLILQYCDP